jgi:hypothetical protein
VGIKRSQLAAQVAIPLWNPRGKATAKLDRIRPQLIQSFGLIPSWPDENYVLG